MLPDTQTLQWGASPDPALDIELSKRQEMNGKTIYRGSIAHSGGVTQDCRMEIQHYPGETGERDAHVVTIYFNQIDTATSVLLNTFKIKQIFECSKKATVDLAYYAGIGGRLSLDSVFTNLVTDSHY